MESEPYILIVDDDRDIRTLLGDHLAAQGFRTRTAEDGRTMRCILDKEAIDLVVLDLNLTREDGLTLCRTLRAQSSVPIIMLTARAEPIDRILGLEMGADDYLSKPFEPRELVARIRNVLRRHHGETPLPDEAPPRRMRFANWVLDLERRQLLDEQDRVIMLSGAEFRFLKAFTAQPNRVLSREQLAKVGERQVEVTERAVDLQISRLRIKLGDDARAPTLIKTVRSEGYVLACAVEREA